MEHLHVAQRRASHSREVRKKLQKEDKKDKKAQNFQTKENINKKKKGIYFRQKEEWWNPAEICIATVLFLLLLCYLSFAIGVIRKVLLYSQE